MTITAQPLTINSPTRPALSQTDLVQNLTALNQIAQTLNQAVDMRTALTETLAQLVELMGLETGWIFLTDPTAQERWWGEGYVLAAHHNLPPALALDNAGAWMGDCECQGLCNTRRLTGAYNQAKSQRTRGSRVNRASP